MTKPTNPSSPEHILSPLTPGLRCELAVDERQIQALSLLLTGRPSLSSPAVEQFCSFAQQHRLSLEQTWVALKDGEPVASVLIVPSAGRTAMAFLSPVSAAGGAQISGALMHHACHVQETAGLKLIQTLLEPQQKHEVTALTHAGFTHLANLLYMERKNHLAYRPLALDDSFKVHHWDEKHRDLFAASILASYEQTQDCPGLLGLRHIDDIIAGHLATGDFDPAFWFNVSHDREPVGVMLLNQVPQRKALELVYLGLNPKWRGCGLSKQLLEHGVGLAAKHGMNQVILAVDADNQPALALYQSAHFIENGCKVAMICTLKESDANS
jgi:ribosomal protein S18 acetylase RimI-like enzyme